MIFEHGVEVIIASRSKYATPLERLKSLNPFKELGKFDRFCEGGEVLPLAVDWFNGGNSYGYRDLLVVNSEEMNQFETPDQFFCHMKEKMDGLCDQFRLPKNEDEFIGEDHFDVYFHFEEQLLDIQEIMRTTLGE